MRKYLLLLIVVLSVSGCINKDDPTKVIAKVGSKVYLVDDINDRISNLDPQLQSYFEAKENKVRLLDQIIEEELIYQLAKKDRLQRTKDFKKTMDDLKRQALINYFIQQNVDNMSEITRSEVEEFYNANTAQFSEYQSRNLSHILLKTKAEAKRVQTKLNQGESFELMAKQFSIDPSNAQGGQLGWVREAQLVPAFSKAAFALTKRVPISGIVQTDFGYHIIKYNDSKIVPQQPLDSVYEKISTQLLTQKKRDRFKDILESGKETVKIVKTIENL